MTNPFGTYLTDRWKALGISQAEFCRRIGSPAGWIQQVRSGVKTPPLERMQRWADALSISGVERSYFCDVARLMHIPPEERGPIVAIVLKHYRKAAQ